ncbi:MAG: Fe-S cluster assembly protein SufD, partial [Rhodospirillales bacterium]|nr:Fe-S cluster assembly protein SufD [Rhodospirillales bacterium]
MNELSPLSQSFIDQHGDAEFGATVPWLDALRKEGIESFASSGLPTPGVEEWKYTNLKV